MSFVEITKLPTAGNSVILLHESDNVAIARVSLSAGAEVAVNGRRIKALDPVPVGHKIALCEIPADAEVRRYGQVIGWARENIPAGRHVHVHNLRFEQGQREYNFPAQERPIPPAQPGPTWMGYLREDGRAGTRNYIAVVAASNCAAHTAQLIAESYRAQPLPSGVDGVVAFPHELGCGQVLGPDTALLQRTLTGIINHPNVAGAIILGLGCEMNQISNYVGANPARASRLVGLTLQQSGGTLATVEAARRAIAPMIEEAAAERRVELPASKIVLGLNCGGSDSFSGITANPALGWASDRLAEMHATAVLAETPECFGAEHLIVSRARSREVAEKFLAQITWFKQYLSQGGGTFNDNPSPGNKDGGLTTILEKSMGAAMKSGTSQLNEVVEYAERIYGPGFVFMNTPGYDPVSLTGLAAGGVNLICFTTGRGSAIGFPTIPVIKIATNTATYRRMFDNMDINAGVIADGTGTIADVGQEILDLIFRAASGERTKAEKLGHKEFVPWRIGPTP